MKQTVFNNGEIVYWCHQRGHKYEVKYGVVEQQYADGVDVCFISLRDRRLVVGAGYDRVSAKDFEVSNRFYKLPKGWSYDTKLVDIEYMPFEDGEKEFLENLKITDRDSIKLGLENGWLVKKEEIRKGYPGEEITKNGYRIVWEYSIRNNGYDPDHMLVQSYKLYKDYETAKLEVEEKQKEFLRQASLSDRDWSIEQIDKILDHWVKIYSITDSEKEQCRNWLLELENIEDVEVKIDLSGNIAYRYQNKKRWFCFETNM